jgi:hypothetical protein
MLIGGKVGIHRPYLEVPGGQVSPDKVREVLLKTLQDMRAYFREMNVSEQLADAMMRINPEQMHLLSVAETNGYGLTAEDPITQEVSDLEEAQHYRVSRQEYARRKNLVHRRCAYFGWNGWMRCGGDRLRFGRRHGRERLRADGS